MIITAFAIGCNHAFIYLRGEVLHVTAQNLVEFRNVATRPKAVNGLGLSVVDAIATKLHAESEGERAAALELALEALYLAKRVDKVSGEGQTVYG